MALVVEVSSLSKNYDGTQALNDLSFKLRKGEILGLLGPNGAGKTTALRILLGILNADSGSVKIFGKKFSEKTKNLVGYMPEERGLYRDSGILDVLVYLASLKGMEESHARKRALKLLNEVGLEEYANSKVNELSKGMQQKVQFISTFLHKPKLVVFDELFSGLDPINAKMVNDTVVGLSEGGTAVIVSTHMMEQAEKMCDRILMIDEGERVLYGKLGKIKAEYGKNFLKIDFSGRLPKKIPGAFEVHNYGTHAEMRLERNASHKAVLKRLFSKGVNVTGFELSEPSLTEIFIDVAGKRA